MSSPHMDSVTRWLEGIKRGDEAAIEAVIHRYYDQLIRFAKRKLHGTEKRVADEDDVFNSALKSFCAAAKKGRFPDLKDRESLWRILVSITARKVVDLKRYNDRGKRKGLGESVSLSNVAGDTGAPDEGIIASEQLEKLFDKLGDEDLKAVALGILEGLTNKEIAKRLDVAVRTVERRRHLIRKRWEAELEE